MLSSLNFQNYRGFSNYSLDGVARVNLLVGKNNSGKTAILEGIHFLTSGGTPGVLAEIASRRGETIMHEAEETSSNRWIESNIDQVYRYPSIIHFFNGHRVELGEELQINANHTDISITAKIADINQANITAQLKLLENIDNESDTELAMIILYNGRDQGNILKIREDGFFTKYATRFARRSLKRIIPITEQPVEYLSPDSLDPSSLSNMWDKVTLEGREKEVNRMLQIFEPSLTDIRFLTGGVRSPSSFAGILVELDNDHSNRLPLGSFGDGMRRLLALAVSMIQSTNGVLLIDEIDTGLHYSVMADLWRLIVESARQANVQVFATTHSLDCLRGLATLCEKSPEYCADVSVHRIEPRLAHSVCFPGNEIVLAIEEEVEIR